MMVFSRMQLKSNGLCMRAQGQLTSWKVTEYNLVIHKPDMQAAADHESYTQALKHTQHTST